MSEKIHNSIESCPNPKIYQFNSLTELIEFENQIALEVCPNMDDIDTIDWHKRVSICEALRPKDPKTRQPFNGQILNIQLTEMPEAYDRLHDATERGLKFGTALGIPSAKNSDESLGYFREFTKGFSLSADAKSTGLGTIGEVKVELYYLPTPTNYFNRNTYILPGTNCIRRYTTRPTLERYNADEMICKKETNEIIKKVGRQATCFNVCKLNNNCSPQ